MHSTSRPSEVVPARLFDGASARPRAVRASIEGDLLVLADEAEEEERVPLALITREQAAERIVLHRTDLPDWRLILGTVDARFVAALPDRHRITRGQARGIGFVIAGVAAAGLLAWSMGARALVWAAPLVPHRIAVQAGAPMLEMIAGGKRACEDRAGRAALDKLAARVMPPRPVEPVTLTVARNEQVNAFTLPGGQVILLSALIDAAETPEELAGVLAHELGHVEKRHPNQALIRHFGFDLFLQGLGGNVGALASTGLFLRNSRAAEREADATALALLRTGRVDPRGLAAFFARMERRAGERAKGDRLERLAGLAATHPSDASRQALFRDASGKWPTDPVLTPAEWRALRSICR
ncbi:M48 family metallopeptidase [Sphingomonas jatrophae]|uniref:Peptidase family M48 n=1 Tax=Sphingomonas jatrophae TaxID=1166337 RepID=A0A1I6JUQ4_9SPHN|nr:M48 family metallopeptidase [Sphingomonas jatrophae]SFR82676.1 Peptidase family M48 [Sphingomonas jatrophae]